MSAFVWLSFACCFLSCYILVGLSLRLLPLFSFVVGLFLVCHDFV